MRIVAARVAGAGAPLESFVGAGRDDSCEQTGVQPERPWPQLPAHVLAELEQIEFRLSGAEQRAARIEDLMRNMEGLQSEIARWVENVRTVDPVGASAAR